MKVLGLIPARSGSKGIPRKNMRQLAGKPLLSWVCEAVKGSQLIDEAAVSSEDAEILGLASQYGVRSIERPSDLARDDSRVIYTIIHALHVYGLEGKTFEYICLAQPTAPLVIPDDYDRAIRLAIDKRADTVISVYRHPQIHPLIMYHLHQGGRLDWYVNPGLDGPRDCLRQELSPIWIRSGLVYVFRVGWLQKNYTLYGDCLYGIEVPYERSVGIDTEVDLALAEALVYPRGGEVT